MTHSKHQEVANRMGSQTVERGVGDGGTHPGDNSGHHQWSQRERTAYPGWPEIDADAECEGPDEQCEDNGDQDTERRLLSKVTGGFGRYVSCLGG